MHREIIFKNTKTYKKKKNPRCHLSSQGKLMVNFTCQLGQAIVLHCLVKHQSRCCHKGIFFFLDVINIKSVDLEESRIFSITWMGLL